MRLIEDQSVSVSQPGKLKMDERKRSLVPDSDDSYPSKRQARAINGNEPRMDPDKEKDIESFQKDAILRQMREYKRERTLYENQVAELTKKSIYHDDHLRIIDSWFSQLLDEIRLVVGHAVLTADSSGSEIYQSALTFESMDNFQEHLKDRSSKIRAAISDVFGKLPSAGPELKELQEKLAGLLAAEKAHIVENQRLSAEKEQLSERLEQASYRYLVAEKKLDRAKSTAVQKLEQQAIMGGNREDVSVSNDKKTIKTEDSTQSDGDARGATSLAAETARKEAIAASEKRRVQTEQLEAENKRLTDDLTAAKLRLASVSDEDYAKTDLYKLFRLQHDDVIKRVNDLEAVNVQLREEAQRLQAERTSYRTQVEDESRTATADLESQLARTETDLARIRNMRDELTAEIAVRKSGDPTGLAVSSAQELVDANQGKISALESEIQRLRLQVGDSAPSGPTELDSLPPDDLKTRLRTLENQYSLLEKELPSMEAAWRKTQALAGKKVAEISQWEEQRSRMFAEKAKADQKYFAAMKAKEAREIELRTLKAQNARSSEIVTQLKDAESNHRALVVNLEKQVSESKESLMSLSQQNRALQLKISESNIVLEGLKTEVAELKKLAAAKDSTAQTAASAKRHAEVELEQVKVRLEDTKKNLDSLKRKMAGKDTDSSDDWRRIAICPVCNSNLRDTALKLCNHVFCHTCVQGLIANRNRKCPSCARAFGTNDHMPIILA